MYKNFVFNLKSFGVDFILFLNESVIKKVKMILDFGYKRKYEVEVKDLVKFRKY